jgi:catalase
LLLAGIFIKRISFVTLAAQQNKEIIMNKFIQHRHQKNQLRAILVGVSTCLAISMTAASESNVESPAQLVGALHSAFGNHHVRAVHAKGMMLEGSFTPAPDAKKFSKASLFAGETIPVTVRFSDFTGIPDIPDNVDDANPRGFAIKFNLADGATTDIVTHSFNGFPTANADEFAKLLRAIGASGGGAAKPTALDKFLASHPVAKTFLTTQKPAPVSFATLTYYGVNAFKFTAANNKSIYVRYRFVPVAGEQFLNAASVKSKSANYLIDEMTTRVASSPIAFDWFIQIASVGEDLIDQSILWPDTHSQDDAVTNPSVAWPESRRLVKLGTINIVRMLSDQHAKDKTTMFSPGNVPQGIAPADPMIARRAAAYPISLANRQ